MAEIISTKDTQSFAYYTITVRIPQILQSVINNNDFFVPIKNALQSFGRTIPHGEVALLQNDTEIAHNMNQEITKHHYTWNNIPFIFAENYFYHKILELTEYRKNNIDIFSFKKREDVILKVMNMVKIIKSYDDLCNMSIKNASKIMLTRSLIGNLADLSQLTDLTNNSIHLLIDDTLVFQQYLTKLKRVDIMLDNSGEELCNDLLFAVWLVEEIGVSKVYLHFKVIPYFVSDAMIHDYVFLRDTLIPFPETTAFFDRIENFIRQDQIVLCDSPYWTTILHYKTLPHALMIDRDQSSLLIFKGDLHYRKLIGDYYWDHTKQTRMAINYVRTDTLMLRVLKSEVAIGLQQETIPEGDKSWMINGKYGIIEYCQYNSTHNINNRR